MNKEELQQLANECKSFLQLSKILSVSNKTAKKICESNSIDCSHFSRIKKAEDYIDKTFFNLTIKSIISINGRSFADCLCLCGNKYLTRLDAVNTGKCKSCGCLSKRRISMDGNKNPAFKGIKDIPLSWLKEYKRNAVKRKLEWNLSIEDVIEVYEKQDKKCALTGTKLTFGRIRYRIETNASIDRIDNSKGYSKDNIQIVLKSVNIIRGTMSIDDFVNLCHEVVNNWSLKK